MTSDTLMQDTPKFHLTNGNSLSNKEKGSHLEEPRKFCICSNPLLLCLSTSGNLALEERRRQGGAEGGKGEGEEREKFTLSDSEQAGVLPSDLRGCGCGEMSVLFA